MCGNGGADMLGAVPMRCLIVDDNADFLAAASELLEREGISVVGVASTTSEGFDRAKQLRPDLTLVDVDLGGESGFDLVRRLAQDGDGLASTVILISTYAESDLTELIEASSARGFLSKPDLSAKAIRAVLGDPDSGSGQGS
jgi:CheY-like chemotaxis protein